MEPVNEMKEMMQSMILMINQNQTIEAKRSSKRREGFPKWLLKQKQNFIMADMGHVLEETLLAKLPSNEAVELDESTLKHKQWAKYRQQNAKAGAIFYQRRKVKM